MSDNPYAGPDDASHATQPKSGTGVTLLKVFLCGCIVVLLMALFLPLRRNVGEVSRRLQCKNNLKQIALALHNYEDVHGALPPAYTVDGNGRQLHSWRTLILPYVDQKHLYDNIDLQKPWNDPSNVAAYETSLNIFRCPSSDTPPGHTTYMGIAGTDAFFRDSEPRQLSATTNLSEVLMVIEVSTNDAVHWMAPRDADGRFVLNFGAETELAHTGGTQAAFGDGSVRFLSEQLTDQERQAMISVSDTPEVAAVSEDVDTQE
jgi:prepilin-type processing-associated H-X9-DG protein